MLKNREQCLLHIFGFANLFQAQYFYNHNSDPIYVCLKSSPFCLEALDLYIFAEFSVPASKAAYSLSSPSESQGRRLQGQEFCRFVNHLFLHFVVYTHIGTT